MSDHHACFADLSPPHPCCPPWFWRRHNCTDTRALLADWAGLSVPAFNTNWSIDLRELDADTGRFLFLINWEPRPVRVDVCVPRASHVGEMTTRAAISLMNGTRIVTEVPAQGGPGISRRLSDPARTALIVLDISAPPSTE